MVFAHPLSQQLRQFFEAELTRPFTIEHYLEEVHYAFSQRRLQNSLEDFDE